MKIKLLIAIFLTITLSSCSEDSPYPADQLQFFKTISTLQIDYKKGQNGDNEEYQKKIESEILDSLKNSKKFSGWVASIESVNSDRQDNLDNDIYYIEAKERDASFYLGIRKNAISQDYIANLHKGDKIRFSGTTNKERSITTEGALRNPEYYVITQSISLLKTNDTVSIPDNLLADIDKTQSQIDQEAEMRDKVIEYFKSTESADILDATWMTPSHLLLGMKNKGGSYDARANVACMEASEIGYITKGARFEIIDYWASLKGQFKSIGSYHCVSTGDAPTLVTFDK